MIEGIGFSFSSRNGIIEFFFIHHSFVANFIRQLEADDCAFAGRYILKVVPCSAFGSDSFRIHRISTAFDNTFVKSIFDVSSFVLTSPKLGEIGLILGEKHLCLD